MIRLITIVIPLYLSAIVTYITLGDYESFVEMFRLFIAGIFHQ